MSSIFGMYNSKSEAKMEIINRCFKSSPQSYFLFAPRGTGKSTWTNAHYSKSLLIDLLAPDVCRRYNARPERLREIAAAQEEIHTIIIDEIQKMPQLLDLVHQLMEQHRDWQFILTGSSSRKLKRSGVDLLAGRAVLRTMHPFMAAELGHRFSLDKALTLGMLPLVLSARRPQETLNAYITLHRRSTAPHLKALSFNKFGRGVLIEAMWMIIYPWRTKSSNEVDLIVYGRDTFSAIEVKNTAKLNSKMVKGLIAFKEDYPEAETCLLYRGEERRKLKNILCIPCEEVLLNLHPDKPMRF